MELNRLTGLASRHLTSVDLQIGVLGISLRLMDILVALVAYWGCWTYWLAWHLTGVVGQIGCPGILMVLLDRLVALISVCGGGRD